MVQRIYTHSSHPAHRAGSVEQEAEKKEMQSIMEKEQATSQPLATSQPQATQQLSTVQRQPGPRGPSGDAPTAVASFVNVPGQLSPVSSGPCSTVQACAQNLLLDSCVPQSCNGAFLTDLSMYECRAPRDKQIDSKLTNQCALLATSFPRKRPLPISFIKASVAGYCAHHHPRRDAGVGHWRNCWCPKIDCIGLIFTATISYYNSVKGFLR